MADAPAHSDRDHTQAHDVGSTCTKRCSHSLLTMTNPNQMLEVLLLFVCSKMAFYLNLCRTSRYPGGIRQESCRAADRNHVVLMTVQIKI